MARKYESILQTVGNTPVVRINRLAPQGVNLFVKIEAFNPLGSVKDRLALGVIEAASSAWPGSDLRIEIMGSKGSAVLVNDRVERWEFAEPQPEDEKILQDFATGTTMKVGSGDPRGMSWEEHRVQIGDLARALMEGRPPLIPGAEARRAVALVVAIYESARTDRTVHL